MKKKKQRIEFSKLLAIIDAILFVFTVLFSLAVWLFTNRVPVEVLQCVTAQYAVVNSFYFLKAGAENVKKISGANQEEFNYDKDY
jgi:glucan phosphoethanolaminetransferase (alkaline phosphatase superfamily)